jgi:hypothetical protein
LLCFIEVWSRFSRDMRWNRVLHGLRHR